MSYIYTSPSPEYSVNASHSTASTFSSQISWSHITQHKCQYIKMVLGLLWLTFISVLIIFISIVFDSDREPWNASFAYMKYLTYSQIYYIVLIIFEWTILSICILFLCQYFILPALLPTIYHRPFKAYIPGTKHTYKQNQIARSHHALLLSPKQDNSTSASLKIQQKNAKKAALNREKSIPRTDNRCSIICQYVFTAKWTVYNLMLIPAVLFHLVHVTVIITSYWCQQTHEGIVDSIIQIIYHITRAFSDILPGLCLIMYLKAKEVYDPVESYIKKYERQILHKEVHFMRKNSNGSIATTEANANIFKYLDNTQTLAAVHSILSYCPVKIWLLFAISFSLYHYLFWPAANGLLFQEFVDDYKCIYNPGDTQNTYNDMYFVLEMCILRPFNGMILTYTIFLALPIGRHHSSQLLGFKSILSPTIFAIIVFLEMIELRFFTDDTLHFLISAVMTLIYLITCIWCLILLCSLMALQSSADRQRHRFHAYREPQSFIVLFEGVFIIILYVLCFGFILRNEENENETGYLSNYIREAAILIFNIVQIFMLFPLRIIGIEPGITKNYFLNSSKSKYKTTFQWIALLNFVTFIYSFIFIANNYASMVWGGFKWDESNNYQNAANAMYVLSYTFTFCMPYYSIWAISQYDKWVNLQLDNLSYPESEFSVNNIEKGDAQILSQCDDEIKEQQRHRIQSETTEMSISAKQCAANSDISKRIRSTPKTIKRSKLTQRQRQRQRRNRTKSEGCKSLDIGTHNNGQHAITPSIPENYNQTMDLFDPSNIPQIPQFFEDDHDAYDVSQQHDISTRQQHSSDR